MDLMRIVNRWNNFWSEDRIIFWLVIAGGLFALWVAS
jgi:hypothetical protein